MDTEASVQPRHLSERPTVVLEARVVKGSGGGPDKTILNTPRFLAGAGYRTLCAYMHPPNDPGFEQLRRKAQRWQAPLVSIPDRGFWDWKVIPQLLNLCRRERVAIWHGHEYKSNLLGLVLRRFWPMRLITTVHGWVQHTSRTPVYYAVDRWCLPRYDRVLCVSEDLHQLSLDCGVASDRCLLVKNAIDTDEFRRTCTCLQAKKELGLNGDRFLIGAVGRLSPEKGFDTLFQALARVVAAGQDVGLLLVGEGEQRDELKALATSLGLGDRIHFAGFQAEPRRYFEAMDTYALSSIREGLPNVVLEAMALEVPLVATRIAGVPQVIEDGRNGLLVDPGAVEDLTGALLRLVRDAELRRRLAQAGRQTVEQEYSFRKRMETIAAVYDELLGWVTAPPR
jgi:glycosyltransferase involved in cell wall biosynthesis